MSIKISVTGHRPDKLGGYSNDVFQRLVEHAKNQLTSLSVLHMNNIQVYTGMALGWDQAIAHACNDLDIPFVACVPFKGQETRWSSQNQQEYKDLLLCASEIVYTDNGEGGYTPWKMFKRNEYMVDACSILLALWNGDETGGTAGCVKYAIKQNKQIINCWNEWAN